jgi:hypothetical protein
MLYSYTNFATVLVAVLPSVQHEKIATQSTYWKATYDFTQKTSSRLHPQVLCGK